MSDFIKVNFDSGEEFVGGKKDILLRKGLPANNEFFVTLKADMRWCEISYEEYDRLCKELGVE